MFRDHLPKQNCKFVIHYKKIKWAIIVTLKHVLRLEFNVLKIIIALCMSVLGVDQMFKYIIISFFHKMLNSTTKFGYLSKIGRVTLCIKCSHCIIPKQLQGYMKSLNSLNYCLLKISWIGTYFFSFYIFFFILFYFIFFFEVGSITFFVRHNRYVMYRFYRDAQKVKNIVTYFYSKPFQSSTKCEYIIYCI